MQGTGGGRFAPLLFPLILLFKQQDLLVINNYLYTVAWGRGVLLEGHSTIIHCLCQKGVWKGLLRTVGIWYELFTYSSESSPTMSASSKNTSLSALTA